MSERRTIRSSISHSVRHSTAIGSQTKRSGKDPRDLHDKNFQRDARQKVIAFLAKHRYPHEISAKTLSTHKNFFSVVWFLLGIIDPELTDEAVERTTDELMFHLKRLKYPYVPPKSTLQAVTASYYLPAMLGLLDWLVVRASIAQHCTEEKEKLRARGPFIGCTPVSAIILKDTESINARTSQSLRHSIFAEAFQKYLEVGGKEGEEEFRRLLQVVRGPELERQKAIGEEMKQEVDKLVLWRDQIMQQPDALSEALSRHESVRQAQNSVRELLSRAKADLVAAQKDNANWEAQCKQLQLEVEKAEREQDVVSDRIKAQPMQLKEVQAVREDLKLATKVRAKQQELLEETQREEREAREAFLDSMVEVERAVEQVNEKLVLLDLRPFRKETSGEGSEGGGPDHSFQVRMTSVTKEPGLTVDLQAVLHPAIRKQLREFDVLLDRMKDSSDVFSGRLRRAEAAMASAEEEIADIGRQIAAVHERTDAFRAESRSAASSRQREADEMNEMDRSTVYEEEYRKAQERVALAKRLLEREQESHASDVKSQENSLHGVACHLVTWLEEFHQETTEKKRIAQELMSSIQATKEQISMM